MNQNKNAFINGLRDGIPIALGYFSVAFSLGIVAKKAGLSLLNHASAGEYAEFTVIVANAPYLEMALVIFITNMRYMLMSCAISQKFHPDTPYLHRFLVGFGITDEIFGISIGRPGALNPYYNYGAIVISLPSWSFGTALGIIAGNILPSSIVSALSVALYGMFIAIIIPASKANKIVGGTVIISFLTSLAVSKIHLFDQMSDSMKISLLTVIIAGLAAVLFPVKDEEDTDTTDFTEEVQKQ